MSHFGVYYNDREKTMADRSAFRNRLQQEYVPTSFSEIVTEIGDFLSPVVEALVSGESAPMYWPASGHWI